MIYLNKYRFSQKVVDQFFEHDYQDRGMTKWQGFYLSDHTVAVKKQKYKLKNVPKEKKPQPVSLIKQRLYYAFKNNYAVIIQLNELNRERKPIELSNKVKFLDDEVVKLLKKEPIPLETIRNVSLGTNV